MPSLPEPDPARRAIVLIAHGSRNADANADLHHFVDCLRAKKLAARVEPAFLELAEPDIPTAAARCVEPGIETIVLLPFFLSAGVHVRKDLANLRQQLEDRFTGVRVLLAEPLGRHPLLVEVLEERLREAGRGPLPHQKGKLVADEDP